MAGAQAGFFTARRGGLTLLEAQRWAGSLATLFAFLACAASGELGPAFLASLPLALAFAQVYGARLDGKREWIWTVFLGGALIVLGAEVVLGQLDIVLAAARFAILLAIHRLWHRRNERDELLLLLLSLLLLCAAAALSAELLFGLAFIGFSITATWAMALTHLRFAIEAGRGPEGSNALLQSRRLATPALLAALAALSLLGLVGAALVFFAFPRVTFGGLRRGSTATPIAGLGDQVELTGHGAIGDDPRVVLRVRLDPSVDPAVRDLNFHWRARALEVWTGQGWRARSGAPVEIDRPPRRPREGAPDRSALSLADIEAVSGFSDGIVLTPPGWPFFVDFSRPLSERGNRFHLELNPAGDLLYKPAEVGDLRYTVTTDHRPTPLTLLRGRGQAYPKEVAPDLAVPANLDQRLRALAKTLTQGKDPADAATEVEQYLSTTLHYSCELDGENPDPLAHFLFERRQGHCELFSSAMVMLLRAGGIPARNVTGYYGGTRTDAGYFAVRAGDAHSWVEVYFPGLGYLPFDPTPAAERGSRQEGLWPKLVLLWDAIQQRWRAFVVDYDLLSQAQLLRSLRDSFQQVGKRLSGKGGKSPSFRDRWGWAALGAVTLIFAVAALQRRRSFLRSRAGAAVLAPDQRRALRLWREARARLARFGLELPRTTTAREAAKEALRLSAAAATATETIATCYLAARWGDEPLAPAQTKALLALLDQALEVARPAAQMKSKPRA